MTTHFLKFIFCTVISISLNFSVAENPVKNNREPFNFNKYRKSYANSSNSNQGSSLIESFKNLFMKKNNEKIGNSTQEKSKSLNSPLSKNFENDNLDSEDEAGGKNNIEMMLQNRNKGLEIFRKSQQIAENASEDKASSKNNIEMMLQNRQRKLEEREKKAPSRKIKFKEAREWIQKEFEKVSKAYGIDESTKVINLYLLGNYGEFSDCLKRSSSVVEKLNARGKLALEKLKKEIRILEDNQAFNNRAFTLLCDFSNSYETGILVNVEKLLNLIRSLIKKDMFSNQAKNDRSSVKTLKDETEKLIAQCRKLLITYHTALMSNGKALNDIAHSSRVSYSALKELEIVAEKFFTILKSLSELSQLVNAGEKTVITEGDAQKTLKLISLRSSISRRLQNLSDEGSNKSAQSQVKLPTNVIISEREYLRDALNYIDKFIDNPNVGLDSFLKIKEILKHPLTAVNISHTQGDPTFMIMNFDESVPACAKVVFGLLKDDKYNICGKMYSFVGNDISEVDTKYGGCLSSTAYRMLDRNYAWYTANYASDYLSQIEMNNIRRAEIVNSYILFNNSYKNINTVLSTAVKNRLKSMFKLSMTAYEVDIRELRGSNGEMKDEQKEQSLIKFVLDDVELGSVKDNKQIANSVVIRTLEKVSRKIVANFNSMLAEFEGDIAKIMENRRVFSKEVSASELNNLINNKFKEFISFNPNFKIDDSQGDKIQFIFNVQKNTISEDDIKDMLYVLAKNSEKVRASSLRIVGGKSSDNAWILEVVDELKQCIAKSVEKIDAILGSENENVIRDNFKKFLNS